MNGNNPSPLETEAGFRALFEYATVGILVINVEGCICLANSFIEKLFGYSKAELIGQQLEILMPESFRQKHVQHRINYFDAPKARPMGIGMNLLARKKNGDEFPVEISLGHYPMESGEMAVAFVSDITELKRFHEALEAKVKERTLELTESLKREKELNEMKSRFVSIVSHEFRTPLSTIHSSASLLDAYNKGDQEEKRKKHIDRITSSVDHLVNLLNDNLSLDKLEQGKVELIKEEFNLIELADEILEEVSGMLKSGQHINLSYEGRKRIYQDKVILKNMLLNLLSNAIKFSEENQEIKLVINNSDKEVLIEISDKGMGIPEEDQHNLFNKYFRAKNVTNIQGTGLGLNIVKKYIELLNGGISFTSKLNEGTTFSVRFPRDIN